MFTKKFFALLLCTFVTINLATGQDCPSVDPAICWSSAQNTGSNHTIVVSATGVHNLNGSAIPIGTYIGVFFDSLGTLRCGGYTQWTGANTAISAQGADAGNDGFVAGEVFQFKYLLPSGDIVDGVTSTFVPPPGPLFFLTATNQYGTDDISEIATLSGTAISCSDYDTTINLITCDSDSVGTVIDSSLTVVGGCDSVTTTIKTLETTDPTAVCQNITVQLDASGSATITGTDIDGGSSDNCGIASLVAAPSTFSCSNVGSNTVGLTVTDINGRTANCSAFVTVQDTVSPVAICNDLTVQLDAAGNASIAATTDALANSSADFSGVQGMNNWEYGLYPAFTPGAWVQLPNWTGFIWNNAGGGFILDFPQLDANGGHPQFEGLNWAVRRWTSNFSGAVTVSGDFYDRDNTCGDGAHVRIFHNGVEVFQWLNIPTSSQVYSFGLVVGLGDQIDFVIDPIFDASCDDTHFTGVISPSTGVDGGSSDACGIASISVNTTDFTCSDLGGNSVTLTVTDNNSNSATCNATITVSDTIAPVVTCQDATVYLSAAGTFTLFNALFETGATDNCSVAGGSVTPSNVNCANAGQTLSVSVRRVDGSLNFSDPCLANVTVLDTISPTAVCTDATISLDGSGDATLSLSVIGAGSSDNCTPWTPSASQTAFTCSDKGPNTVTLTITDGSGNADSCTATVTVVDDLPPTAVCTDATVWLDASGNGGIGLSVIGIGSSDNCGTFTPSASQTSFSCADIGDNPVLLTITDLEGLTDTCTATVTVQDTLPRTFNYSADLCNGETISFGGSTIFGGGLFNHTYTDANGCDSTVFLAVTVRPVYDITINLITQNPGDTGTVVQNLTTIGYGCDSIITTITGLGQPNDDCADAIALTVGASCVADTFSNLFSTAEGTGVAPDPSCGFYQGGDVWFTAVVPASGNIRIEKDGISGTNPQLAIYTGTCGAFTEYDCMQLDDNRTLSDPALANQTIYIRVYGYNNPSGGEFWLCVWEPPVPVNNQCVNAIHLPVNPTCVPDTFTNLYATAQPTSVAPNPSCGAYQGGDVWFTFVMPASGNLHIDVPDVGGGNASYAMYTGDCGSFAEIFCSSLDDENTIVNPGVAGDTIHLRVWRYNTEEGLNFSVCLFEPILPPNEDCTTAIFLPTGPSCDKDTFSNAYAASPPLTVAPAPSCGFYQGSDVWFTTIMPPSGAIRLDLDNISMNPQSAIYTGTCGGLTEVMCNQLDPDNTYINEALAGDTLFIRVWSYNSEEGGDFGICLWEPPVPVNNDCANPISLDVTCGVCIPDTFTNAYADAEAGIAPNPSCFYQGGDVWFTAVMPITGELTITRNNISGVNASIAAYTGTCGSFSEIDCSQLTASLNISNPGLAGDTLYIRVFNYNNEEGGIFSLCAADLTSSDVSYARADTICDNESITFGTQTITTAGVYQEVFISSRGCDSTVDLTVTVNATYNEIVNLTGCPGDTGTVVQNLTTTSGCDSVITTITSLESTAPTAVCQDITVNLVGIGATIMAAQIDNGSSDACGIDTMILDDYVFGCSDAQAGSATVTLTVTDNSGNTATCTSTVTVVDNTLPSAACKDITVQLNASGTASITATQVDNGSFDACNFTRTVVPSAFTCTEEGSNTVTLTVTDPSGNADSCTATVTVEDNVAPNAVCQDITISLDAGASASHTAADINNGSSDACGIASLSAAPTSYGCSELGANTSTLTVTDNNGNSSTCVANVTVNDPLSACVDPCSPDLTDPTAVCQDITLYLDAAGNASHTAADIDDGSSDFCGIDSLYATPTSYSCADTGVNVSTLTVTDIGGNTAACSANVTVLDTIVPVAVCQNITVNLDASGSYTLDPADINGGSSDNCGIASLTATTTNFNCGPIGSNTVGLIVTDHSGNTLGCNADVFILDVTPPTAVCQDITVYLDASGSASIVPDDVDNGSSDECGVTLSVSPATFDCDDVGSTTTVLGVLDPGFSYVSCTANVEVLDTISPVLMCSDTTVSNDAGECQAFVNVNPPAVMDNCAEIDTIPFIDGLSTPGSFISDAAAAFDQINVILPAGSTVTSITVDVDITHTYMSDLNIGLLTPGFATVVLLQKPITNCPDSNMVATFDADASVTALQLRNSWCNGTNPWFEGSVTPWTSFSTITGVPANGLWTLYVTDAFNLDDGTLNSWGLNIVYNDPSGRAMEARFEKDVKGEYNPVVDLSANASRSIEEKMLANMDNARAGYTLVNDRTGTDDASGTYPLGTTTVNWTVTDPGGNTAICSQDITVEDNEAPNAVCQDITVYLDASGNASHLADDIDGGSTDNCGPVTLTRNNHTHNCNDVGDEPSTLFVTDSTGNQSTCLATVTVVDTISPTAICQDLTVYLDATGNAAITASDVDNGSSDVCGIDSLSIDNADWTCSEVFRIGQRGVLNFVTLTATDVNGNTATCGSNITVLDTISPTAVCQDVTVQLDGSGNAGIVAADIDGGSGDACGLLSLSASPTSFNCGDVGGNTVTLTVTDDNSNVSTCTANVTVADTIPPVAVCQSVTVQLNASGNASVTASAVDDASNDNCGVASLSVTPNSFNCSNTGSNTVTLTVTDVNGNSSTCTATVTVADTVSPVAVCQDITIDINAGLTAGHTAGDIDGGSSDNCGVAGVSASPSSYGCSELGANTSTLTVTDVNGNVSTCTATVTVNDPSGFCVDPCSPDLTDPTAVCQDITVELDSTGNASIDAADVDGGSSDLCGGVTLSIDTSAFDCDDVGANTVTLTVTDGGGNSSTCTATVTVEDNIAPLLECQDITVYLDASGSTSANVFTTGALVSRSDNCGLVGGVGVTGPNPFNCSHTGSMNRTIFQNDVNGNVTTCMFNTMILDTISPTAICQDLTVQLDASGNASITAGDVDNGSSDACGIDSLSIDISTFSCADILRQSGRPVGNIVTLTATDNNGNVSTCTSNITVEDNIAPSPVCQNITVYLNGAGNATITAADIDGGSTDNCGGVTLSASQTAFTCADLGPNNVTLTVTDDNTNSATCIAVVTVIDTISPTITCPGNQIETLNASCQFNLPNYTSLGTASDNCAGSPIITQSPIASTVISGDTTITLTADDGNGNTSSCTFDVLLNDATPPTAVCQNISVYLDGSGNASIVAADINGGSTDNCSGMTLSASPTAFTCADLGPNNVTLTATDGSANSDNCVAVVTVVDTISPVAICQDITVYLDGTGNASHTAADIDGGSSDNCGSVTLTRNNHTHNCNDVGNESSTLTVDDGNGNTSSCVAAVTVVDTISPTAVCQDITVYLDGSGNGSILPNALNGGSSDNCPGAILSVNQSSFTCTDIGPNNVTMTSTDASSNTASCVGIVTVMDTIPPIAICQDITVELDSTGNATITANDVDNGSSDNCGIDSISIDNSSFTCGDVVGVPGRGPLPSYTLTVTDVNGNTSTCSYNVSVEDNIAPTAICQDVTVQLDASGNGSITAAVIDGGSSDACGILSLTASPLDFTCGDTGGSTSTLTVTDDNLNTSSCVATVTVMDTISPVAVCQDVTIQLDASGNASITAADVNNGSSDICGIDTLTVSPSTFDCSQEGSNQTVTLTVTDFNGNPATCTATVHVIDQLDPIAVCQDITVELDSSGAASITPADIDGGSSDNCGWTNPLSATPNTFSCGEIGANSVTLSVGDGNGNQNTCTATVTVEDNIAPSVVCQDVTVYLPAAGPGNSNPFLTGALVSSSDNCTLGSLTQNGSFVLTCSDLGVQSKTLTQFDVNLNSTSCTYDLTVLDTISPVAVCQDITIQLDASGNASITAADVNNGSSDNCGIDTMTIDVSTFSCVDILRTGARGGVLGITLTVTDDSGNSSTCISNFVVEDNVAPIAICQDVTVQLDASGNGSITANDIDNGSNDACGILSLSASPLSFTCGDVGGNTSTLTVTDDHNNTSTCTANVMVQDNIAPSAVCQDITVQIQPSQNVVILAGDVDGGSSDNCGVSGLSVDATTFDCLDLGANTVSLTVTDVNGNNASCSAVVTVGDINNHCPACTDDFVTVTAGVCDEADLGTTIDSLFNAGGCDSIVTTNTFLLDSYYITIYETTCDINEESKAEVIYTASNGCDSIVRTFVVWVPPVLTNISLLTCDPGEVGIEVDTFPSFGGCDSIVTTSTILEFPSQVTIHETSCLPADTGTFVSVFTGAGGCDSVVTTIVELTDAVEHTIYAQTCTPGEEGTVVNTYTAANGCDSVVTIITTLLPSYQTVVYEFSCNPADGGVEYVHLMASNGCDSTIIIKTEVELVRAGFNYTVTGSTVNFTNTGQYATGYFWVFGDGSTSTDENPVHTYAHNGLYLVWQIVYAPQCGFDIKLKLVFVFNGVAGRPVNPESVFEQDADLKDMTIFPNPTSGIVQLDLDIKGSVNSNVEMTISDVAGNTAFQRTIKPIDQQLDLSGLQPGYYILSVTDGASILQRKILILR